MWPHCPWTSRLQKKKSLSEAVSKVDTGCKISYNQYPGETWMIIYVHGDLDL